MYKTLIATAFTAAVAITAPAVHAQDIPAGRVADQTSVTLRNVDFQNPEQARRAYDRLVTAAHNVCHSEGGDVLTHAEDEACERQSVKDALDQLNQPALYRIAYGSDAKPTQQLAFNDRR